jgi:hypothetical protein
VDSLLLVTGGSYGDLCLMHKSDPLPEINFLQLFSGKNAKNRPVLQLTFISTGKYIIHDAFVTSLTAHRNEFRFWKLPTKKPRILTTAPWKNSFSQGTVLKIRQND